MNKSVTTIIAVAVIMGGGAFYGGIKYMEGKNPRGGFSRTNSQDHSQEFNANVSGAFGDHEGGFRGGRFGSGESGSRPLSGEILSQTEDSLTIELVMVLRKLSL